MKLRLLLILCSVLAGCASLEERPVKVGTESQWITLERTYTATEDCSRHAQAAPGWKIIACATFDHVSCRIKMQPTASDDTLGHETRHCFDGAWHR